MSLSERRQFLALPKKERHRILSEQAKEMADFYENNEGVLYAMPEGTSCTTGIT